MERIRGSLESGRSRLEVIRLPLGFRQPFGYAQAFEQALNPSQATVDIGNARGLLEHQLSQGYAYRYNSNELWCHSIAPAKTAHILATQLHTIKRNPQAIDSETLTVEFCC